MAEPTQHTFPSDEGTPEEELSYLLSEGSDLLQAGKLTDAKREIERALAMQPGNEQARNLLGLTLFRLGDLDPAQSMFEELVHDNPVEPSLRLNLAMVHLKAGRLQAAREELERALDLNPDHKRAASYMAMVCERLCHFGEAAEWYTRAGNEEQAAAMRARSSSSAKSGTSSKGDEAAGDPPARGSAAPRTEEDDVPEPPPVFSGEGAAEGELMPDPLAVVHAIADGEVQAAALSALRAEALSRPRSPPSAKDAVSARQASKEFTLDVDDAPASSSGKASRDADEGYVDPFADDAVEATKPYAPNPYFNAGDDVSVTVGGMAAPTKRGPEVTISPVEVAPDDVELEEIEPVESTLPYASLPKAPPGRTELRAEKGAVSSPPPASDESVPEGLASEDVETAPPRRIDDDGAEEATWAPPDVIAAPPRSGAVPDPVAAPDSFAEITLSAVAAAPSAPSSAPSSTPRAETSASSNDGAPAKAARELPSLTLEGLGARGAAEAATNPFVDDDGLLVFPIHDAAYLRTDLLVGLRGNFEVEPVYRRYRGRRTDSFFGGSKTPLAAALGDGRAWLDAGDAEVSVLALGDEELYLVESTLLAFTSGLVWENGRLPEPSGKDLDIVHLRGSGRVVLQTKRRLRAIESGDHPVTVSAGRLVGWAGALVPSRGLFPGLPDTVDRPSIVRFEGSGRILVV